MATTREQDAFMIEAFGASPHHFNSDEPAEETTTAGSARDGETAASGAGQQVSASSPGRPFIKVVSHGDGSFAVSGSSFLANARVNIRIVDNTHQADIFTNTTSDGSGTFTFETGGICRAPGQIFFSANDGRPDANDKLGTLISNTVPMTCPNSGGKDDPDDPDEPDNPSPPSPPDPAPDPPASESAS